MKNSVLLSAPAHKNFMVYANLSKKSVTSINLDQVGFKKFKIKVNLRPI